MNSRGKLYSVSELAGEFDLTAQALRFYEEKGLLSPARSGRNRVYSYRDRARLVLILKFRKLGFSLDDIVEYISFYDKGGKGEAQYRVGLQKIARRIAELERMKAEIDDVLGELRDLESEACRKLEQCLSESPDE